MNIRAFESKNTPKKTLLKRRAYPSFCKLDLKCDLNILTEELSRIESINGWADMDHGSPLVENLLENRKHLAECFQDENGNYSKYSQIILTDKTDANTANQQVVKANFANPLSHKRYKKDVLLERSVTDEGLYNTLRPFMSEAPQLSKLLKSFGPGLMRARFAKISPGFSIKPHIDYDLPYGVRYHIAFTTNKDCSICVKRTDQLNFESFHIPADGNAYFVNTGFLHYAENLGTEDRIHLVLSVRDQSLLADHRLT